MDRGAAVRRLYEAINTRDMGIFDEVIADDFVEHEELPGLEPSKAGVRAFFESFLAAFPDLRMEPVDILESGDKVVARVKATAPTRESSSASLPQARRSTCSSSTSSASATMASRTNIGGSWTS